MPIPSVNELMGPVLEILGDSKLHGRDEIIDKMAAKFNLAPSDMEQTIGDTSNPKIGNQIDFVRLYFTQFGITETPEKGWIRITEAGLRVLRNHLAELNISFLKAHFSAENGDTNP